MGRCYEFGVSIDPTSEHAMVVAPEGGYCVCPSTGAVCRGRFAGCSDIVNQPGRVPPNAPAWSRPDAAAHGLVRPAPSLSAGSQPEQQAAPAAPGAPLIQSPPNAAGWPANYPTAPSPAPAGFVHPNPVSVHAAQPAPVNPGPPVNVGQPNPTPANPTQPAPAPVAPAATVITAPVAPVAHVGLPAMPPQPAARPAEASSSTTRVAEISELLEVVQQLKAEFRGEHASPDGRLRDIERSIETLAMRLSGPTQQGPDVGRLEQQVGALTETVGSFAAAHSDTTQQTSAQTASLHQAVEHLAQMVMLARQEITDATERQQRELHAVRRQLIELRASIEERIEATASERLGDDVRAIRQTVEGLDAHSAHDVVTASQLAETINTLRDAGAEEISAAHLVHSFQLEIRTLREQLDALTTSSAAAGEQELSHDRVVAQVAHEETATR